MVPQPPVVRFGARESRAVDARLLARAQSDDRAAIGVGYAVRLGVLQSQRRDDQILNGTFWELVMRRMGEGSSRATEKKRRPHVFALADDIVI
jgi:hypothetical protein